MNEGQSPKKETPVNRLIQSINGSCDMLENNFTILEDDLVPVLGEQMPTASEKDSEKPSCSPLATSLESINARLRRLADRMSNIASRLEV